MNAKSNTGVILLWCIIASQYRLFSFDNRSEYGFHRTACRKAVLFKLSDRGKKLTGGANSIIQQGKEATLSSCVKACLGKDNCITINYKRPTEGSAAAENCQLLNISKSNGVMVESTGWNHYEPVKQVLIAIKERQHFSLQALQLQQRAEVHLLIDICSKWFASRIFRANIKRKKRQYLS